METVVPERYVLNTRNSLPGRRREVVIGRVSFVRAASPGGSSFAKRDVVRGTATSDGLRSEPFRGLPIIPFY